ncbi:MAG: hypothetical protein IT343_15715 [Candidatus Melainabacteria bacterium]|nr:hypothetical protein [Candidatus Melainabacteria bacterium]
MGFFLGTNASSAHGIGWKVTQFHEINGKEVTYVSERFVRVDRLNNHFSVLILEREGMIYFFSDKLKLLYKARIPDFNFKSVNLLRMFTGGSRAGSTWKRIGKSKIGNASSVCFESADYSNVFRGTPDGGFLAGEKSRIETITNLYVSDEIILSKTVSKLLSQLQGTKDFGGLPLKEVTTWKEKNKSRINIDLLKFEKVNVDESKGHVPSGFRLTGNLSDIINLDASPAEELLCK